MINLILVITFFILCSVGNLIAIWLVKKYVSKRNNEYYKKLKEMKND